MGKAGPYTEEEDEILRRNAHRSLDWDGWKELLPNRSKCSINSRRARLGIGTRRRGGEIAQAPDKATVRRGWGEGQRIALREGVAALVAATGHTLAQCAVEYQRMQLEDRKAGRSAS